MILFLCTLLAVASGLSSQCADGGECQGTGYYCIESKFCVSDQATDAQLFVAGMSSVFVDQNDLAEAECLGGIVDEVDDIYSALEAWNNGDDATALADLASGLGSIASVVSSCAQAAAGGSFWDDVADAVQDVIGFLCPQCGVVMDDASLIINGVEIIDDWTTMYQDCNAGDADDIVACGAAFGDSIQRIYSSSSVGKAKAKVHARKPK